MASPIRIFGTALRYAGPVLIVGLGLVAARALVLSRKAPARVDPPARALAVEVVTATAKRHEATLPGYGTVRPLRSLVVRPTVGGPIEAVHPGLIEGGRIDEGEGLLTIDVRDFELAVTMAEATLAGARADLDVELGNAEVAAREWELLDRVAPGGSVETTEVGRRLALREPYVARRRADVESATAQLTQARLNLERSTVRAPFPALVLSEDVELGTQVSAGSEVARIVDRTEFLVEVSVPESRLGQLDLDSADATVIFDRGGGDVRRSARVVRWLGEVATEGRMARVHVAIPDPLGEASGDPPVLLGSYVRVELPALPLPRAVSVPRIAVHEGDVVWTIDDRDRLVLRDVQVALRRPDDILVTEGLSTGDRIVISSIAVPLPGMQLMPVNGDGARDAADPQASTVEPEGAAR